MTDLVILLVLLVLSGIFSGSETALVALSIGRAEALVKDRRRGARALYQLKRDPSRMLTTILIGNNLGKTNGWIPYSDVIAIVTNIED